ncbi:hypothetical protein [Variovorax sp. UC122_21]|uniref:hypothetical protein n=1 Tax=Variovorax sp. UC122_21 TaxID=3374554 RepID=UPI003756ACFE
MNSRSLRMPPTCGRISAMTGAAVRPGSSVLSASVSCLSVTVPTSRSGAAALGAAASLREQPASVMAAASARAVMSSGKGRRV